MAERLKQIPAKLLEFWNKYTGKQKAVIISVVAVIILAFVLLYFVATRVQYEQLNKFDSASSANQAVELLQESGIKFKRSRDGTVVSVDKKRITDALVLMDTNGLPAKSGTMSWSDALKGDMSTSQQEKLVKQGLAMQSEIRGNLLDTFDIIKEAAVNINPPTDSGTIFSEQQDTSVGVLLTLSKEPEPEFAKGIALYLSRAVGNSTTDKITIVDNNGKVLFSGGDESGLGSAVSDISDFREKLRKQIAQNVKDLLLADNVNEVQVATSNLQFKMDTITEMYTEYTVPEGSDNGYIDNSYEYSANGTSGSGGLPGTDSNSGDTDTMIETGGNSDSEVILKKYFYNQNQRVQNITREKGAIDVDVSSMAVALTQYQVYNQEQMERDDALNGLTWDEFKTQNSDRIMLAPDEHVIPFIAAATGLAQNQIQVQLWQQPIFQDKITKPFNVSNYLMIILAVLIVALLIFVVFKGTAPVEVTELEPELSVEQLLATTKENQSLEDIEFSEASETKRMIDKFVDENPDAVANLLRNWLNEDWG